MAAFSAGFRLFFLSAGWIFHVAAHPWNRFGQSRRIPALALYRNIRIDVAYRPDIWLAGFKIPARSIHTRYLPVFYIEPGLFCHRV